VYRDRWRECRAAGGRRIAEDVAQHPDAALYGLGFGAVRRGHEDTGLGEQATELGTVWYFDAVEPPVGNLYLLPVDLVEQALVVPGEIRLDEGRQRTVRPQDFGERALGFTNHPFAVPGLPRDEPRVGRDIFQATQAEPLAGEVADEAADVIRVDEAVGLCDERVAIREFLSRIQDYTGRSSATTKRWNHSASLHYHQRIPARYPSSGGCSGTCRSCGCAPSRTDHVSGPCWLRRPPASAG
jgi:hypothetical protein